MILSFTLTMPNNNSWNGKWSGEGNLYVKTKYFGCKEGKEKAAAMLAERNYYYNFGDGWGAAITIKEVTSSEATKLRKNSKGFYGYEWMIDSIIKKGKIVGTCSHGIELGNEFHCDKCQEWEKEYREVNNV